MNYDISVIIPTYLHSRLGDVERCVESVLSQTYPPEEIIIISDSVTKDHNNKTVYQYLEDKYANNDSVQVIPDEEQLRVTAARNRAAEEATGDILAFIDDDAIADEQWLEKLVEKYDEGYISVGGKAEPIWVGGDRPFYLTDEMLWLVGVNHNGFRNGNDTEGEVRNTFACNFSVLRDKFEEIDGYRVSYGKNYGHNYQGEEAEIGEKINDEYGQSVYYVPDSKIYHHVYPIQTTLNYLIDRSFWQGFAKADMESNDEEHNFLKYLCIDASIQHLKKGEIGEIVANFFFAFVVGIGFIAGKILHEDS